MTVNVGALAELAGQLHTGLEAYFAENPMTEEELALIAQEGETPESFDIDAAQVELAGYQAEVAVLQGKITSAIARIDQYLATNQDAAELL